MGISEAKGVSKAEEGLRLLLPSPSSSTTAEALDEEKLEEKSDGGGISLEGTGWDCEESPSLEKHSTPSPSQLGKNERPCYPQRPGEPDCSFYLKAGSCRYGSNCKFNHPARRKRNKAKSTKQPESTEAAKGKEIGTSSGKVGKIEGKKVVNVKQNGALPKRLEHKNGKDVKEKQKQTPSEMVGKTGDKAVKEKQDKTLSKRMDQTDQKNYSMPGGSKFEKTCKYDHCKEKSLLGPVELNFLGLPMRPGERECYYYLRTGGCKFATNCRYHHPDPTAVGGQDTLSGYQNGGSPHQYASGASALPITSWPLHGNSNEPAHFFASGFLPLPQGISNPEWNAYQAPAIPWLLPELNTRNSLASTMKDTSEIAVVPNQQQSQVQVEEYPERPGQPECHHFMKNGDCKFKSACRFHHPRTGIQKDLSVSSPS